MKAAETTAAGLPAETAAGTPDETSARPRVPAAVVVPAYEAAATLPRALQSIDAQTVRPAEVVLVDDASTDATSEVMVAYRAAHPDLVVKVARLPRNAGAAAARNAGWEMAEADLIAFLDADDAWHPLKLELQTAWMLRHPQVALSGHRCVVAGEDGDFPAVLPEHAGLPVRWHPLRDFLVANRLSTPTVMLRRGIAQRFTPEKRYSEDYLLWMQIVAAHGAAGFIDLPLTTLFKARYGATGLSGHLLRMHRGELDTLGQLRRKNIITTPTWALASMWIWAKFLKRIIGLMLGQRRVVGT